MSQSGRPSRPVSRPRIKGIPFTQEEIARQLGVTREHLSRVRHGHRKSPLLARYNKFLKESA